MAENSGDLSLGYMMGMDSAGGNNGGGFGMDGGWGGLIGLLIVASLFGWGRNGGGIGNFGGGGGGSGGYCFGAPWATQADVRAAVDQQTLISKIDQQTYGLADTFTALNNTLNNNFRTLDGAICTLGYQAAQHANNLSHQLSDCCCETRAAIQANTTQGVMNTNAIQQQIASCCCDLEKMNMQNRFDAERSNCGTLQAIDKLGDRILGYLANQETQNLRDEVQSYRLAASQAKQNQYLIDQLRPCPVPAYITCNPYAASYGFGSGFGGNNCGCGCG